MSHQRSRKRQADPPILLTPWQAGVLERMLEGHTVNWPRRAGRSTITRFLAQRLRRNGNLLIHKGGKP
ncbi:hypothetical protein SAMN04487917_101360 [Arthrobacter sp. yr096]|nr:hypothetical protein SAMN04487917_101360 [Arthrobacter sp. yr096]